VNPCNAIDQAVTVVAVVVTHQPDVKMLTAQTLALLPQVHRIIWVDNGSSAVVAQLSSALGVDYINLCKNTGIAHAQNVGAERAFSAGATHVLLMDHDSVPAGDMVEQLLLSLDGHPLAAAAGPWYQDPRGQEHSPFVRIEGFRIRRLERPVGKIAAGEGVAVDHLIASGCLIHREAWDAIGSMADELFIDFVDVEWCLRARSLGWTVIGVWNAHMEHHLGHAVKTLMGRRFHVHSPARHYFHIRNGIYLARQRWIPWSRRWVTGYRLLLKCGFYLLVMDNRRHYLAATLKGAWHAMKFDIAST